MSARLERLLRVGFQLSDFQATKLWAAIRAWEIGNVPYVILACRV